MPMETPLAFWQHRHDGSRLRRADVTWHLPIWTGLMDINKPNCRPCLKAAYSRTEMVETAQLPLRAADDPVDQLSPQLGVRTPEVEGREERCVKRGPTSEEDTQD